MRAFTKILTVDPKITLTILGEGTEIKTLQKYIRLHSLKNNIFIRASSQHVSTYLKDASIVVMTSLYEGMSLAVLEAMAAGRVVVATSHPGADEYIKHNSTGFIASNEKEFIAYIHTLLHDKALRLRMSSDARQYALANFSHGPLKAYAKLLAP